jgi:hypothetical protein
MGKRVKGQAKKRDRLIVAWGAPIIVFIALLSKGLYNEEMLLLYGILVSCFFLYFQRLNDNGFGLSDLLIILFAVSSTMSFLLNAANPRGGLLLVTNILMYLMFYNIIKKYQRIDEHNVIKLFFAILFGVLTLIGSAIFEASFLEGAFQSILGYSNSFAVAVVVAILINIYFLFENKQNSMAQSYLLEYSLILAVSSLIVTKSRGAFLILVLSLIVVFLFNKKRPHNTLFALIVYLFASVAAGTIISSLTGGIFLL